MCAISDYNEPVNGHLLHMERVMAIKTNEECSEDLVVMIQREVIHPAAAKSVKQ